MTVDDVTKEQFKAYVFVQNSGETNMFDRDTVQKLALDYSSIWLSDETIATIMQHYSYLKEKYGDSDE